jgi:hypothetical protein
VSDPSYSVDQLRKEQQARYADQEEYQRLVMNELRGLKIALAIISGALTTIALVLISIYVKIAS